MAQKKKYCATRSNVALIPLSTVCGTHHLNVAHNMKECRILYSYDAVARKKEKKNTLAVNGQTAPKQRDTQSRFFPPFPQNGTEPSPGAAYGANILNAKSILSVPQARHA
jgi:uncharacterized protein YfaP (DUF2135 family)